MQQRAKWQVGRLAFAMRLLARLPAAFCFVRSVPKRPMNTQDLHGGPPQMVPPFCSLKTSWMMLRSPVVDSMLCASGLVRMSKKDAPSCYP